MPVLSEEDVTALLAAADVEGLIASGSPASEYEPEAEIFARAFSVLEGEEFNRENILEIITYVWADSFDLDDDEMSARTARLEALADSICAAAG